ncbi:MAG: hypothetical protein R2720_04615 [Candidatus Nanopelagicales bacterium]
MFTKSAIVASCALALLAPAPAVWAGSDSTATTSSVDPATGKIAGYTYGKSEVNSYPTWSGGFIWTWFFSSQHIGYGPGTPVAGVPFYLHAHTSVIAPHSVTGNVLVTIDQDAGGLPLRYAPSASMPTRCSRTQFDPVQASVEIPCPASVKVENGQFVVSNLEPLVPGFGLDIEFPVVVDNATSGTAAMTAMWATTDVSLSNDNVLATVPVTVAVNPNPPTNPVLKTKSLPKKMRKAKKVHSTTPKTCTVKKKKVVFHKHKVCKVVGKKNGHKVEAKVRF